MQCNDSRLLAALAVAGLKCNVPVHVHSHNSQHHRTNCTCPLFMSRFQPCAAGANVIMDQSNAYARHPKHNEQTKQMRIYAQICTHMHTAIHIVQVLSVIIGQSNAVRPDHTIHRRTVVSQHSGVVSAQWCGAEKRFPSRTLCHKVLHRTLVYFKSVAKGIKCGKGHSSWTLCEAKKKSASVYYVLRNYATPLALQPGTT